MHGRSTASPCRGRFVFVRSVTYNYLINAKCPNNLSNYFIYLIKLNYTFFEDSLIF